MRAERASRERAKGKAEHKSEAEELGGRGERCRAERAGERAKRGARGEIEGCSFTRMSTAIRGSSGIYEACVV